ncbi:Transcriptional activator protein Anr [Polaromonas vacuolata]|uniref:Transcriptional activator protein Anr n=2 Tax=Polaromonas vacuolata TaxID=37448 RepID=A0A6H2H6D3_9BURK|nr:Transcriptional activator protein Anr [Polaromonas vacuolata]
MSLIQSEKLLFPHFSFFPNVSADVVLNAFRVDSKFINKESQHPQEVLLKQRKLKSGESLFNSGDKLDCIYIVKSGTFKTLISIPDGRFQIVGFHMSGELLGLSGIANRLHVGSCVALEKSVAYELPWQFTDISTRSSLISLDNICRLLSLQIINDYKLMLLLGVMNSEERLIIFLLNLSERLLFNGFSASDINLSMSRAEIGEYLGIKVVNVSRIFGVLTKRGLIEVSGRRVRIIDITKLFEAAYSEVE